MSQFIEIQQTDLLQQLSMEFLVTLLVVLVLIAYVLQYGVKEVCILAISGYLARALVPILPLGISPIGDLTGEAILFLLLLGIFFFLYIRAPIAQSIKVAKKPYWLTSLFALTVGGFLLSSMWYYNQGVLPGNIPLIAPSMFQGQIMQIIWMLAPISVFFFLKSNNKSS